MLAHSPRNFAESGLIEHPGQSSAAWLLKGKLPYSMTNKGLVYPIPWPTGWREVRSTVFDAYILPLACFSSGNVYSEAPQNSMNGVDSGVHCNIFSICLMRKYGN